MADKPYDKKPQWMEDEEGQFGFVLIAYIVIWPISFWLLAITNFSFKTDFFIWLLLIFFPAIVGMWIGNKIIRAAHRNRKSKGE
jgi:hypothetical protein